MNKIYFDNKDWSSLILIVLFTVFIGLGLYFKSYHLAYFSSIAVLILIVNKVKRYGLKHYVKVRDKTIYIKLNGQKGFEIEQKIIVGHEFLFDTLIVTTINNDCFVFNTKDINKHELECLHDVLMEFSLNDNQTYITSN